MASMAPSELIPSSVPLAGVRGLTPAQATVLNNCWITTAQELIGVASGSGPTRGLLAQALGVDAAGLNALVLAAQAAIPAVRRAAPAFAPAALVTQYGRGAILQEPPAEAARRSLLPFYIPGAPPALPESVNRLGELPPIRNQGARGTCVAHAVLAVREHLEILAGHGRDLDLSEQFVYWWCKGHDGIPTAEGTYLSIAMRCLTEIGAPRESLWPYVMAQSGDEGQGPPPSAAANGDHAFCIAKTIEFNRIDITGIKTRLNEGHVVAFAVPVFDSWYYSSANQRWGKFTLPLPGEQPDGGHAMALVGYQDDPAAPGGGYFLLRNSWQPWSYESVLQPGYGYIPYAYIARFAQGAFSAERVTQTSLFLRDNANDSGARPLPKPAWNSPDVWLRQSPDGTPAPQAPAAGQPNHLYVHVVNAGPAYAYSVKVEAFTAPLAPCVPPANWQAVGDGRLAQVPPVNEPGGDDSSTVSISWMAPAAQTPGALQGYALQARLATSAAATDPTTDHNVAQNNLGFLELGLAATGRIDFVVQGLPEILGEISFEIDRGNLPADATIGALSLTVLGDQSSALAAGESRGLLDTIVFGSVVGAIIGQLTMLAGERRLASLPVTIPAGAQPGAQYALSITELHGGTPAGRLEVRITVIGGN
jgi:Papain family cysteine protease